MPRTAAAHRTSVGYASEALGTEMAARSTRDERLARLDDALLVTPPLSPHISATMPDTDGTGGTHTTEEENETGSDDDEAFFAFVGDARDFLELEMDRFLETEFFDPSLNRATSIRLASDGVDDVAAAVVGKQASGSVQSSEDNGDVVMDAFSMDEKLFLTGASGSIDIPDLDFSDLRDAAGSLDSTETPLQNDSVSSLMVILKNVPTSESSTKKLRVVNALVPRVGEKQRVRSKRPNRAKDEASELRRQLKTLDATLHQLEQTPAATTTSELALTHPLSLWKRIASRQRTQREQSEAENAKLRSLLDKQLKFARSVATMLRKRPHPTWLDDAEAKLRTDWLLARTIQGNSSVFELLERRVDSLYAKVDALLEETGLAATKTKEVRVVQVKQDAHGQGYFEIVDSSIVPFDLRTTSSAAWTLFRDAATKANTGLDPAQDPTSHARVRAEFSVTLTLGDAKMVLHDRLVGKQIAEDHRSVVVWSTVGESDGALFGKEHIDMRRDAWTVIEKVPSPSGDSSSTIIQTIMRMVPTVTGVSQAERSNLVGKLTDLVLDAFPQKLNTVHQMLENLILKDAPVIASFLSSFFLLPYERDLDAAMKVATSGAREPHQVRLLLREERLAVGGKESLGDGEHELTRFLESEVFTPSSSSSPPFGETAAVATTDSDDSAAAIPVHDDGNALFSMEDKLFLVDANGSFDAVELAWTPAPVPEKHRDVEPLSTIVAATASPSALLGTQSPDCSRKQGGTVGKKRRNVVKEELEYLRDHVKELESHLSRLQQCAGVDSGGGEDSSTASSSWITTRLDRSPPTPWQRIAKRQLDEKQKSQVENAKLRELYESQLKIVRSLAATLRKRPDTTWFKESQAPNERDCFRFYSIKKGDSAFEQLARRVDALYAQVDAVLIETGFTQTKAATKGIQAKVDAQDRIFLEIVDAIVFPFDLHTTSAAVWKLVREMSMRINHGTYQAVEITSDTLQAEFTMQAKLSQGDVSFHTRLLGKQIVEENRVVLVWSTMDESQGALAGQDCIRLQREGWTVLEETPPPNDMAADADRNPSTILQTVVRMTPEVTGSRASAATASSLSPLEHLNPNLAGVLTDLMCESFPVKLEMVYKMIEDLVLADTFGDAPR